MIIKKILNNNAIVTNNESGREIIAVGRGIAFSHKKGDSVSADVIQKIYTLSNPDVLEKFEQLIASISIEYVQVSNEIIELAEKELDCKFNDIIYISLTDHIHMAVHRIRNGYLINNVMLWEVCKFYEREFLVAQRAVNLLNARFQVNLPEDEAGFIAMHLIDGQTDSNIPLANKMMKLIQEIINIVRITCKIEFDKQSLEYYRFITHLKFFVKRVLMGQESKNEIEDEIALMVKSKYRQATECAEKIAIPKSESALRKGGQSQTLSGSYVRSAKPASFAIIIICIWRRNYAEENFSRSIVGSDILRRCASLSVVELLCRRFGGRLVVLGD